jgi:hypothetical protein
MEHPSLWSDEGSDIWCGGKASGRDSEGKRVITIRHCDSQILTAHRDAPLEQLLRNIGSGWVGLDVEFALSAGVVVIDASPAGGSTRRIEHDGIRQLPSCRRPSKTARMEAKGPKPARQALHRRRVFGSFPAT